MSMIYVSETADSLLLEYLTEQGHQVRIIKATDVTYPPVSTHPDIYMCGLGPSRPVFFGCLEKLGPAYPENIRYNAVCTGKYFIHNLKRSDPELLEQAAAMEAIHVSQGYTKCNVVIVDENSIITSDMGIYKACRGKLDALLVQPGHVKLRRFPYGFLGGASGRVGDAVVFNGDLSRHPDFAAISSFIKVRNLELVYFRQYPLEDIGSIIEDPCRLFSRKERPRSDLSDSQR
ncbi:MAG: hypothetical protein HFE75_08600 [Firmicutes bacterium]|nr:hypothetical protein [Bacillota bacterium]